LKKKTGEWKKEDNNGVRDEMGAESLSIREFQWLPKEPKIQQHHRTRPVKIDTLLVGVISIHAMQLPLHSSSRTKNDILCAFVKKEIYNFLDSENIWPQLAQTDSLQPMSTNYAVLSLPERLKRLQNSETQRPRDKH